MSQSRRSLRSRGDEGYSLVELVVTAGLIAFLSAVAYSYVHARKDVAGGEEQALRSLEQRLMERRLAAIRLNPLSRTTTLETVRQPPVELNLLDPESTQALVVEGTDADGDGYDDSTGTKITVCNSPGGSNSEAYGTWSYAYTGSSLVLPTGWSIAASTKDLESVPLISEQGVGEFVTDIFFTGSGTAVVPDGHGGWRTLPSGATSGNRNAPFWAVYLISSDGLAAAAMAVHPSGALETWRWNPEQGWLGYANRSLNSKIKL